jgi:hypothetical protein
LWLANLSDDNGESSFVVIVFLHATNVLISPAVSHANSRSDFLNTFLNIYMLDINLRLQAAHDGVAQKKAEKVGTAFQRFRDRKKKENLKGVLE